MINIFSELQVTHPFQYDSETPPWNRTKIFLLPMWFYFFFYPVGSYYITKIEILIYFLRLLNMLTSETKWSLSHLKIKAGTWHNGDKTMIINCINQRTSRKESRNVKYETQLQERKSSGKKKTKMKWQKCDLIGRNVLRFEN